MAAEAADLQQAEEITWTTPSGFKVVQDIRHPTSERVRTQLMGSAVDTHVCNGFGGPSKKDHQGAIAPNLVHSYDASLLHLTFAYWSAPFTVIHDCVLGRSCDMDQMAADIRLHFSEMYKGLPLKAWADEVGASIPDGMMKNSLDLDSVLESPYFFC